MRTPTEHIKTLQRRIDFLKAREHINSFDKAEVCSLEWALANLQSPRTFVGLTEVEINEVLGGDIRDEPSGLLEFVQAIEAKLKEKNNG